MAPRTLVRDMVNRCSPSGLARQSVVQESYDVVRRRVVPRRAEDPPLMPLSRRPNSRCAASAKPVVHLCAIGVPPRSCVKDPSEPGPSQWPRAGGVPRQEQSCLVQRQDLTVRPLDYTRRGVPLRPRYAHVVLPFRKSPGVRRSPHIITTSSKRSYGPRMCDRASRCAWHLEPQPEPGKHEMWRPRYSAQSQSSAKVHSKLRFQRPVRGHYVCGVWNQGRHVCVPNGCPSAWRRMNVLESQCPSVHLFKSSTPRPSPHDLEAVHVHASTAWRDGLIRTSCADGPEIGPLVLDGLAAEGCVRHQFLPPLFAGRGYKCRLESAPARFLMELSLL